MNPPGPRSSLTEIAAWVASALAAQGIRTVLVGGAAVSAHTANRYQSMDVDLATLSPNDAIAAVMLDLGFRKTGRVWTHPRFVPTVDFVGGPPAVGNLTLVSFMTLHTKYGPVTVTTPTQSLMDRLAAFYHWNDRQGLEQAILIARHRKVDYPAIARWSEAEGMEVKHRAFLQTLAARKRSKPPRRT